MVKVDVGAVDGDGDGEGVEVTLPLLLPFEDEARFAQLPPSGLRPIDTSVVGSVV